MHKKHGRPTRLLVNRDDHHPNVSRPTPSIRIFREGRSSAFGFYFSNQARHSHGQAILGTPPSLADTERTLFIPQIAHPLFLPSLHITFSWSSSFLPRNLISNVPKTRQKGALAASPSAWSPSKRTESRKGALKGRRRGVGGGESGGCAKVLLGREENSRPSEFPISEAKGGRAQHSTTQLQRASRPRPAHPTTTPRSPLLLTGAKTEPPSFPIPYTPPPPSLTFPLFFSFAPFLRREEEAKR